MFSLIHFSQFQASKFIALELRIQHTTAVTRDKWRPRDESPFVTDSSSVCTINGLFFREFQAQSARRKRLLVKSVLSARCCVVLYFFFIQLFASLFCCVLWFNFFHPLLLSLSSRWCKKMKLRRRRWWFLFFWILFLFLSARCCRWWNEITNMRSGEEARRSRKVKKKTERDWTRTREAEHRDEK